MAADPQSTNLVQKVGMMCLNKDDEFNNIPDSILPEIFKRLPVKSLLRCCCVQKSWYCFIRSPLFINIHSNYNPNPNHLLFESIYTYELLLRCDNQNAQEFCNIQLPSVIPISTKWNAASAGLLCFSTIYNDWHITNYTGSTYLFNPLIRKYKTLPPLLPPTTLNNTRYVYMAFGYVPLIKDYRVVKLVNYFDANQVPLFGIYVYSLGSNSWTSKTIRDEFLAKIWNPYESVFVNGVAFWRTMTNGAETLLCFDAINGILRNIPLPDEGSWDPSLQQFGQFVAYFTQSPEITDMGEIRDMGEITDVTMWILRGDPMKDFFWEMKFMTSLDEDIRTEVLGVRNNGELILSKLHDCDLVSYNYEDDEVKDFVGSWNRWSAIGMERKDMDDDLFEQSPFTIRPFVEGLVLLDAD